MTVLIIVNDGPYASERAFNAFRLALALQKTPGVATVRVFCLSDAVLCGLPNQLRPEGSYSIEAMAQSVIEQGGSVKLCSTCVDHRGLFGLKLGSGVAIGSMPELGAWVTEADRVVTF